MLLWGVGAGRQMGCCCAAMEGGGAGRQTGRGRAAMGVGWGGRRGAMGACREADGARTCCDGEGGGGVRSGGAGTRGDVGEVRGVRLGTDVLRWG